MSESKSNYEDLKRQAEEHIAATEAEGDYAAAELLRTELATLENARQLLAEKNRELEEATKRVRLCKAKLLELGELVEEQEKDE